MSTDNLAVAALVLAAAGTLVERIQAHAEQAGFGDLRPAHGFVFARVAGDGATVVEIADHLGVTKQAASQVVEELARKGYVTKRAHPADARARLIVLTPHGVAATEAAERAAEAVIAEWSAVIGVEAVTRLRHDLGRVVRPGRIRPTW